MLAACPRRVKRDRATLAHMHVVTSASPPTRSASGRLTVYAVPMATDNLGWLVVADGAAAIVDGPEAGPVLAACDALGVRLTTVINTHTHHDHIGVNRDLERRGLLAGLRVIGPGAVAAAIPGLNDPVAPDSDVTFGGVVGRVILTEGHLSGHVSYHFDDLAFTGDALFTGGCGYLFSGPPAAMFEGLARLAALPSETWIFCGHEYTEDNLRFALTLEPTNGALHARIASVHATRARGEATVPERLAVERATNPFLRSDAPELVRQLAAAMPEATLDSPLAVFAATRKLKDLKRYKVTPANVPGQPV